MKQSLEFINKLVINIYCYEINGILYLICYLKTVKYRCLNIFIFLY